MLSATSAAVPMRPSGVSAANSCMVSALCMAFISVSITPGATQLTRMPDGPSSSARDRVSPMSAALLAA